MRGSYVIDGYIFSKKEDAAGGAYFDIIHPDGRYLDYGHFFASEQEMKEWIQNRRYWSKFFIKVTLGRVFLQRLSRVSHTVSEIVGDRAVICYGTVVIAAVKLADLTLA